MRRWWRRRWAWWWGLAAVLLAAPAFGQAPRFETVTLLPATTATTSATATGNVVDLGFMQQMRCVLAVTAISGAGPTLNVRLQTQVGTEWDDYASFTQATATGVWTVAIDTQTVSTSPAHVIADGTLAAGTVHQGAAGQRWRVKYTTAGTFTAATFSVTCNARTGG